MAPEFGLSVAEKRHYEEHGYVIKRGVFPAAECRALTEHMTRVHDAGAPGYPPGYDRGLDDWDGWGQCHLYDREIERWMLDPRLRAPLSDCMGGGEPEGIKRYWWFKVQQGFMFRCWASGCSPAAVAERDHAGARRPIPPGAIWKVMNKTGLQPNELGCRRHERSPLRSHWSSFPSGQLRSTRGCSSTAAASSSAASRAVEYEFQRPSCITIITEPAAARLLAGLSYHGTPQAGAASSGSRPVHGVALNHRWLPLAE
eukprot:COSAG04_NODE_5893_length_1463_cov_1.145161_1_plen_257_part_00